jgi:hypothetical protein
MITQYPHLGSSSANALRVSLADSAQLDSFSRLRVSEAYTLFDSQQEYGLDTLRTWDATANGSLATGSSNGSVTSGSNAVGPVDANTRMTPLTVSSTSGHYSILQSRQYTRYVPGKGHLVLLTGIFAPGESSTASVVNRTSTSGAVVDTEVLQSAWNIDKFDGTGVSGLTIDFTKTQILFIQAQWLGVGRVVIGFDINGVLHPAHQFLNANSLSVPYTQSFNLPVRYEIRQETTSAVSRCGYYDSANGVFLKTSKVQSGGTIQFVCCSVQTEGGITARGYPFTSPASTTTIAVTTRRPVLSIRPKTTYNSRTNRAHINEVQAYLKATTNDALYEIVIGGTLTGAAFASVNTNSVTEVDVAATAITGGLAIVSGFISSGSGSVSNTSGTDIDARNPLVLSKIDALTATQTPITLVCTSVSGTSNIASGMNWHELTI